MILFDIKILHTNIFHLVRFMYRYHISIKFYRRLKITCLNVTFIETSFTVWFALCYVLPRSLTRVHVRILSPVTQYLCVRLPTHFVRACQICEWLHHKNRIKTIRGKLSLRCWILYTKIFKMIQNIHRFGVNETWSHQSQDDGMLYNNLYFKLFLGPHLQMNMDDLLRLCDDRSTQCAIV